MMRVRLKADGRLVEILPDGSEWPLSSEVNNGHGEIAAPSLVPEPHVAINIASGDTATYARRIRANVKLTQEEFARRIGVPVETVRNWEQGKREPRGPARALLKLIEHAPDVAFSVLGSR